MRWFFAAFGAIVGVVCLMRGHQSGPCQAQIGWVFSIDDALRMAQSSRKPVLVHFYASW